MNSRWLVPIGVCLVVTAFARCQAPPAAVLRGHVTSVGHLVATSPHPDHAPPKALPYEPQPGDIILYDDFNKFFHFIFKLADTAPPTHTSMVIAKADGKPALLELTGPKVITARVQIMEVDERFRSYPGIVMVRKIREPLTAEQSRDLTQFAEAQVGKGFALARVALQITPFRPRTGLRKELFGHTYLNRDRWICSELVLAACATAKILDGKKCCANAMYPRDLAVDEVLNLSASHHPPILWSADVLAPELLQAKR